MNRYNFIESKGIPPAPQLQHLVSKGSVEVGQAWLNVINGSVIKILGRNRNGSWTVHETVKGNFRVHDNGEKQLMENFILSFYKLT